jgi:hypothetical protein
MDRARHVVICLGGSMDPGAAFLLIRGMKTMVCACSAMRHRHDRKQGSGKSSQSSANYYQD